jgi:tetratricopeptide (TPR) repeat protein
MQRLIEIPSPAYADAGQAILVVAPRGTMRREALRSWLAAARQDGFDGWLLDCDFNRGGPWAGISQLVENVFPTLQESAPDLIARHDYEITSVVPKLRKQIPVLRLSLTDLAPAQEQTRLFPPDRALRILHGIIDLLMELRERIGNPPWLLACDDFDRAQNLSRTFFLELLRRRGPQLGAPLLLAMEGSDDESLIERVRVRAVACLDVLSAEESEPDRESSLLRARHLEAECEGDPDLKEHYLGALVEAWTLAGDPEKILFWRTEAFTRYTMRGYYREALVHGEVALRFVLDHCFEDERKRASVINKLFACYCAIGEPYKALRLFEQEGLTKLEDSEFRVHFWYQLAMLYTRFLSSEDRDLRKAEEYLENGLAELLPADMPFERKQFLITFNRNGLALVRHRQGRPQEAIDLCREGYERILRDLGDDQHRLHRSVLLYNIAQVYAGIGELEEALLHFDAAIEIDERYSEYYNERAIVKYRLGRLPECLPDYRRAINLSPPYPEVFVNLGQCLRALGSFRDALDAYDKALDLKPDQSWVWVMRAECCDALGETGAALSAYDAALDLDPSQASVLANRACLLFSLGEPAQALADLDQAIGLSPETPELYQNRAVALSSLGLRELAIRDLERYLSLSPQAPDNEDVTAQIAELSLAPGPPVLTRGPERPVQGSGR